MLPFLLNQVKNWIYRNSLSTCVAYRLVSSTVIFIILFVKNNSKWSIDSDSAKISTIVGSMPPF